MRPAEVKVLARAYSSTELWQSKHAPDRAVPTGGRSGAECRTLPTRGPASDAVVASTTSRRGGRVVECGSLENCLGGIPSYEGSNPSLSARRQREQPRSPTRRSGLR